MHVVKNVPRLPALDALRVAAICLVLLWHAQFEIPLPSFLYELAAVGWCGVDLFFVLSGYLVSLNLFAALSSSPAPRRMFSLFYLKRCFRILPCFLVMLLFYGFFPFIREKTTFPPIVKFLSFTLNYDLAHPTTFSHAWSLCIEEQFYLIFPFLVFIFRKQVPSIRFFQAIVSLLLLGIAMRAFIWRTSLSGLENLPSRASEFTRLVYFRTHTHWDGILVGMGMAWVNIFLHDFWKKLLNEGNYLFGYGAGCLLFFLALNQFSGSLITVALSFTTLSFGFVFLLCAGLSPITFFGKASLRISEMWASLVYPMYLTHKAVLHFCAHSFGRLSGMTLFCLSHLAVVAVSLTMHALVERPFLKWRDAIVARVGEW